MISGAHAALAPFRGRRRPDPIVTARTRAGDILWLPRIGGGVQLRRAQGAGRPYWRNILPALCGNVPPSEKRLNLMTLVLSAKRIPYISHPSSRRPALLVPIVYEGPARYEISAFEAERLRRATHPTPKNDQMPAILGFFFLLVLWHGLRMRWFVFHLPDPPFPANPAAWPAAFGLDVFRTVFFDEWWRAGTALFLHANADHLFSNIGFGCLFFWALNRRVGAGPGFAFALAAGMLGNVCNAFYKPVGVISIGFSTALFGAVGVLSGVCACDAVMRKTFSRAELRFFLLPVAAGLAFLAMFGGGGEERTDYAAHLFGFGAGLLLGMPAHLLDARLRALEPRRARIASRAVGGVAALAVVLCWVWAL